METTTKGERWKMKQYMMIIGCEIIHSDEENPDLSLFKLTLQPLTNVKQEINIEDAQSGGLMGLIGKVQTMSIKPTATIHITLGEWRDRGYKIGRHVTLELLPDDTTGGVK